MRGIGTRLDRLAAAHRRRGSAPPSPSAFDAARLTFAEQVELDDLLRPLAPLPGEPWDLEPLSAAQLERAHQLVSKGHGRGGGAA